MPKETRISFRVSKELKERLANAAIVAKRSETELAEACVEALIEYVEAYKEITTPLSVLPKSVVDHLQAFMGSTRLFGSAAARLYTVESEQSLQVAEEPPKPSAKGV